MTLDGTLPENSEKRGLFGGPKTVRRWSRQDGRLVAALSQKEIPGAVSIDLAPDGETFAASIADGAIRSYSTDRFQPLRTVAANSSAVNDLTLDDIPNRAVGWQALHLRVIDPESGAAIQDLGGARNSIADTPYPVTLLPGGDVVQFSPERKSGIVRRTLTASGTYRTVWRADLNDFCWTKACSPHGALIAVGTRGGAVRLLNALNGATTKIISHRSTVHALAFSPAGDRLASGSDDGTVKVTEASTGRILWSFPSGHGAIWSLAFSHDGRSLAMGTDGGVAAIRELESFIAESGTKIGVAGFSSGLLSKDGSRMVVAEPGRGLSVLDPRTDRQIRFLSDSRPDLGFTLSADGRVVVAVGEDDRLRAWLVDSGGTIADFALSGPTARDPSVGWAVSLSPDGRRALLYPGGKGAGYSFSYDHWTLLLDLRSGRAICPPQSEIGSVSAAKFSPDGSRYLVSRHPGLVQTFDAQTGRIRQTLANPDSRNAFCASFSPRGDLIAVGRHGGWIDLYDGAAGSQCRSWIGHEATVWAIGFTADRGTLLTCGLKGTVRLWDVRTGGAWEAIRPSDS